MYHTADVGDIVYVHIDQLESSAVRWRGNSLVDLVSALGAGVMAVFYYIGVYSSVMDLNIKLIKGQQYSDKVACLGSFTEYCSN